ncbi:hypothetical protein FSS13T_19940 [Flavobacterium saliperosum S13]|uniref:Uncharacterized protein n=1 Tax=Flavobacterium saliperosum S13 TaxID=1341155 RepID=A0ABN0QF93_9FLAO|nr:hypothetical protein FSS13T_19940 [Flavobacterium saliperosum S13]
MNFPNKQDLYRLAPMGAASRPLADKADSGNMVFKHTQTIRSKYFDYSA